MAKRRVAPARARGARTSRLGVVATILVCFVLVASAVVWRRSLGVRQGREIQAMERQRIELTSRRAKLVGEVRVASMWSRLAPVVERRLDMRIPSDSQVVYLRRPGRPRAAEGNVAP